jgi:hypothetical protein
LTALGQYGLLFRHIGDSRKKRDSPISRLSMWAQLRIGQRFTGNRSSSSSNIFVAFKALSVV